MVYIEMLEVYRTMLENPEKEYVIKYVRSTKRGSAQKGSIKTVKLGLTPYARKLATGEKANKPGTSNRKYLHKDKWTMNLYNWKKNRVETPLYSHIIEFDGKVVKH